MLKQLLTQFLAVASQATPAIPAQAAKQAPARAAPMIGTTKSAAHDEHPPSAAKMQAASVALQLFTQSTHRLEVCGFQL
jgi:hypothetical protein